jgi:hypothetical protein
MKITRRALALSALAGAVAAQPPSQSPPAAASDLDRESRQQVETTSQALLHYEIPMSVAPAFEFKP